MAQDPRIPDFPNAFIPNFSLSDVPIIGPMSAKVGRVFDLFADPCGPSLDVWVTALWWAAPKAFIDFTKPDLDQIMTNRAGRPHKRNRRLKWKGFAVDPWNAASSAGSPKIPINPRTFLWRFFTVQQRIGFYIMVADIGLDFTINWFSMAYTLAGCDSEVPKSWKGVPSTNEPHPDTGNWTAIFWDFEWHPPGTAGSNNQVFPPVGTEHSAGLSIRASRWSGSTKTTPFSVSSRIVRWPDGKILLDGGTSEGQGSDTIDHAAAGRIGGLGPGMAYRPEINVTGDDVNLEGSYFTVAAAPIPFPFIGPDP